MTTTSTINRMNDLAVETTNTVVEGALLAQRQGVAVAQSVLNNLQQNQEANRTIATTMIKQAQEAQQLWAELAQESVRTMSSALNWQGRATQ